MFLEKDNYIVVNYHYVEDFPKNKKGFFPCSVSDFDKQIKFLAENYSVLTVENVFKSAVVKEDGRFCAVTFDDGLKDQYFNALPILEKYGVVAAFFPIASVFDGGLPLAHKIHTVLSCIDAQEACDAFNGFLKNLGSEAIRYTIPHDRRLTTVHRLHEDLASANFKETMKIAPLDVKNSFLNQCFKQIGLAEVEVSHRLFMDPKEIKDLHRCGMTIGSHSHSHTAMDLMADGLVRNEVVLSSRILFNLLGEPPKIFSYPHGGNSESSRCILAENGFEYALTIDQRGVKPDDDAYLIPRYDAVSLAGFLSERI